MYKLLLPFLALLLVINNNLVAQTQKVNFPFSFHVFDEFSKQNLEECALDIFENDKLVKTIYTNSIGVVKYNFKVENNYRIIVKSKDNYIEKIIEVDTRNIAFDTWKYKKSAEVNIDYEIQVQLFKPSELKCQNFTFLNSSPVMLLRYDTKSKDLKDLVGDEVLNQIKKERRKTCKNKVVTHVLDVQF